MPQEAPAASPAAAAETCDTSSSSKASGGLERLSFPEIWVESFCQDESSGDEEQESPPLAVSAAQAAAASASPTNKASKVIRSLLYASSSSFSSTTTSSSFSSSCDVSFESVPSQPSSGPSSRQNSFQRDNSNEALTSPQSAACLRKEEELHADGGEEGAAATTAGRCFSNGSSSISRLKHSVDREKKGPSGRLSSFSSSSTSSSEQEDHLAAQLAGPERREKAAAPRKRPPAPLAGHTTIVEEAEEEGELEGGREKKEGEEAFFTPVASLIDAWLNQIESQGFDVALLQAFTRSEYDTESEDDVWFETGLVRVFDPYYDLAADDIAHVEGRIDPCTGTPVGKCTVKLQNGDELFGTFKDGLRQGRGSIEGANLLAHGVLNLRGYYKDSVLMGRGIAMLEASGLWPGYERINLEGVFNDGYLEGPVRGLDPKGRLVFIGEYLKGLPIGPCWLAKEGQGWLHGAVDKTGRFSGSSVSYLYPDRFTCLSGVYQEGVLVQARPATVANAFFSDANVLGLETRCSDAEKNNEDCFYSYSPSNNVEIPCDWTLPDPYETRTVECRQSSVDYAGDGLYALRDLPAHAIVAYYNGLRVNPGEKYSPANCNYQIYVDWGDTDHSAYVDVPTSCVDVNSYCASLAHKANHSFTPNCTYVAIQHPRFGRIPALKTLYNIAKGSEMFAHYKYDMALAPTWYVEAYEAFSAEAGVTYEKTETAIAQQDMD